MPGNVDPLRVALQIGLYIFFYVLFLIFFAISGFASVLGLFAGSALSVFIAGVATNILTLRIYEGRKLADIGFHWNPTSAHNLIWGLAGGVGSALVVLGSPLAVHAASLQPAVTEAHVRVFLWVMIMLVFGAAGEEVLFRGYGFQVLMRSTGRSRRFCRWACCSARCTDESPCFQPGPGKYRRVRHAIWVRVLAQPGLVAAFRPALRMELYIARSSVPVSAGLKWV